jgi:hypothetical protein
MSLAPEQLQAKLPDYVPVAAKSSITDSYRVLTVPKAKDYRDQNDEGDDEDCCSDEEDRGSSEEDTDSDESSCESGEGDYMCVSDYSSDDQD